MRAPPKVAIIGRPNVGKSTLFNRLVGKKLALVDDTPGVTRDRRIGKAQLGNLTFDVIDTAGLEEADPESLAGRMRAQTEQAILQSDVVLFVIDARAGLTPLDEHFARILRKSGSKIILLANKAEGRSGNTGVAEAYGMGFGTPLPISAEHGEGMNLLYDALREAIKESLKRRESEGVSFDEGEEHREGESQKPLSIAVVGRPNAGKSTLINRLIGEERLLTGPEAGITRDSIAVNWVWQPQEGDAREIRLVDTAGLRRKARIEEKLEKLSVADALRAIRFAEVVIVVVDATMPFEKQDLKIADLVVSEGRAFVVALNKWDLISDRVATLKNLREMLDRLLPQVRGAPMIPVSALQGYGLSQLMQAAITAHMLWNKRISTGRLNRWLSQLLEHHPPPAAQGRRIKVRYMTQAKSRPPHFILFTSQPEAMPESYTRYLINGLRDHFEMPGVPIRLSLRGGGENPYHRKE